ncbi:hypothetical protein PP175_13095 [Aneurinibacillus sp. Ricciae_BoGa-3]|uniref:hypothetical protein n=1 Tax=Aneurinibacillus sp. Ricciae_BoGa-3 TaxID=3022697 RepID=UPI00234051D7|nr:hypothetical protein [Aneurinibacillus sp. Ricciae_BoGa-3]WCK52394.1 hypothetical protein PP175_13095 [Aneurinibacillus sp. Ricciae_BoGa-3]
MYVGVFDVEQRLEQMKKLLKEKKRLKELLESDIEQIERDVHTLEARMESFRQTVV